MSLKHARQLIQNARLDAVEDLLAPAIAIRPRVLYAAEPRAKRTRWLDWLLKPAAVGPAVATVPVLDELTLPIGTSRFDPVPDVPVGFEWPCTPAGEMMECLAQIDLSRLSRAESTNELPKDGWLLFFVADDQSSMADVDPRVIYLSPQPLTRWTTDVPRAHTRRTCRMEFDAVSSLPDTHDWCVRRRLEFVNGQIDRYVALQESLTDGAKHYLLGYPRAIQGDVRAEAAQQDRRSPTDDEALGTLGDGYTLLLQLDSDADDDGPGWMWGDAGTIYFVIRKDDLRAGRFDRTRLVLQCG